MKLFTTISALFLASSSVLARPLEERTLEERQAGITYLDPRTQIYPRYEVRTLKDTKPNQYTLLIVALNRWYQSSQSDIAGYFQQASIHGVPRDNYNGVGQCSACGGTDGYAVHDSVLFPLWHRCYLAQFEQQFIRVVKQVASEYPSAQRQTMVNAANQFRWPYYDAAAKPKQGNPNFPLLMSEYSVTVNGPSGKLTIVNPLFRYSIKDPSQFVYQYFTQFPNTLRYPNSNSPNAASNEQAAVNAFQNIRQGLADSLYSLFSNCHDWLHFSNDAAGSSIPSCAGSVEDVHNSIHTAIGGSGGNGVTGGHMYYLPISSFDPSFWLHHANIDRMVAFWQTLNQNSFAASQGQPTASWTIPQGQVVSNTSPLTPFKKRSGGTNPGGFWTPDLARNWRTFGYTYPEYYNTAGDPSAIRSAINRLYGPNAGVGVAKRDVVSDVVGDVESTMQDNAAPLPIPLGPLTAPNSSVYQYVANIYTPRYLLDGSYQVFLFNTPPASETDTTTWITDSNLIGLMGVLSKPNMTDNKLVASGSIPLTRTLQEMTTKLSSSNVPLLSDLSEALVVPYLTKNLEWRVAGPNNEPLDPSTIPGFVVSVFASTAPQPASDADLPTWSEFVNLVDVTKDQAGGANSTQQATVPIAESMLSAASSVASALPAEASSVLSAVSAATALPAEASSMLSSVSDLMS